MAACAGCSVPAFHGAIFFLKWKEALWANFFTAASPGQRRNRPAIQNSQESLRALSKCYGINPKTVAKWKCRASTTDHPTGPKQAKSSVLSIEEEAIIIAFRKETLLPLDDCLYALQPTIAHLSRSSLHRCLASAMASADCRKSRVTSQRTRRSSPTRSAAFTSTSPRYRRLRASSTCS